MRAIKQTSTVVPASTDTVFAAVLGVVQNTKSSTLLAVHNEGRKLVVRDKPKMSNPKIIQVLVAPDGQSSAQLHVAVGTDPRSPKALLDSKLNEKFLKRLLDDVQAAVDGSQAAPATPVSNHYVQKKEQIPWTDPDQDPEIELGGNFRAMYGL